MDTINQDTNNERGFDTQQPDTNEKTTSTEIKSFEAPVTAQSAGFTGSKGTENTNNNTTPPSPPKSNINTLVAIPNSGGILTLGILSIVMLCCCGPFLVGPVLGILAIALTPAALRKYNENPEIYKAGSLSNIKAGRICGIIGLSIGVLLFAIWLISAGINGFDSINEIQDIYQEVWDGMNY